MAVSGLAEDRAAARAGGTGACPPLTASPSLRITRAYLAAAWSGTVVRLKPFPRAGGPTSSPSSICCGPECRSVVAAAACLQVHCVGAACPVLAEAGALDVSAVAVQLDGQLTVGLGPADAQQAGCLRDGQLRGEVVGETDLRVPLQPVRAGGQGVARVVQEQPEQLTRVASEVSG